MQVGEQAPIHLDGQPAIGIPMLSVNYRTTPPILPRVESTPIVTPTPPPSLMRRVWTVLNMDVREVWDLVVKRLTYLLNDWGRD